MRRIAWPISSSRELWENGADRVIDQTFRYLGRGRQCFAFESLDGSYVLKFPRTDIYHIPFWVRALPFFEERKKALCAEREKREQFVFNSMGIAYDELRQETGILALHLGKTKDLGKKVILLDPLGIPHQVPVHSTSFVLQVKRPLLMKAFLEALHTGDRPKAQQILNAFINVVMVRGKKEIWNKDESFLRNYGFDGKKGYQIDVGSFYHKSDGTASIRDTMHPVQAWLAQIDEEMLQYFNEELERKIAAMNDGTRFTE